MKLKIKVGDLLAAVSKANLTVDKKGASGSNMIYLKAIKTETTQVLYVYSTTVANESAQKLICEVEEAGEVMANPQILEGGLTKRDAALDAEIEVVDDKKSGKRLRVKAGKTGAFFCALDPQGTEFMAKRMAALPFKNKTAYELDGTNLNQFVRRALFCIPQNDNGQNRFQMGGLKMFSTDAGSIGWATNGKAAARFTIKGENQTDADNKMRNVIIPKESLPSLNALAKKDGDIRVIEGNKTAKGDLKNLFFHMGDTFFGTSLLTGQYPNLDAAFKQHEPEFWFTVNRQELSDSLARCPNFDGGLRTVEIEVAGGQMLLHCKSDAGNEIEDAIDISREVPDGYTRFPEEKVVSVKVNMDQLANVCVCEDAKNSPTMLLGISSEYGKALVIHDTTDPIDSQYALMPLSSKQ
jgi:DNA polymerase III sliding clamp (beta) subunit (PCNA family)